MIIGARGLGHTRVLEGFLIFALGLIALRTMLPIGNPGAYGTWPVKVTAGLVIGSPAVWLVLARSVTARARALFWIAITFAYVTILAVLVDWTRLGTAGALLALGGISAYLHYLEAKEARVESPSG